MKLSIYILFIAFFSLLGNAQSPEKILLINGYLHEGNGTIIESAAIGIEKGEITLIKNSLAYSIKKSDWDTIIDLAGRHVYPGFIAPNSTLGITEIDAVKATRDYDEVGHFNPHVRSQIAYNVESKVINTVRINGVLVTQATPRGGRISGSSSIMFTDGWNWEDATLKADDGLHINWPSSLQGGGWWAEPSPKTTNKNYDKEKDELYQFFKMAKAYSEGGNSVLFDARFDAMVDCFKGEKRVYFHANEIQQLLDVIEFSKAFNLKFPVVVGGYDGYLITRQLVDANIPIMLVRAHSLPENEDDDVDLPYKLPYLLKLGGVKFCLQNEGDMEAMNTRNLPFLAGTAMAYGLTQEEAISAITLNTAEIMGINKNYGSLETGKSATLFVSDGNALDMRTNNLFLAMVNGQLMSTSNSQVELYKKYSKKYKSEEQK